MPIVSDPVTRELGGPVAAEGTTSPAADGSPSRTGTPWFFRLRSRINISLAVLLFVWPGPRDDFAAWKLASGLLLIAAGLLLRLWCIRQLGGAARKSSRPKAVRLVTWGPFGHVRNPIYLANAIFFAGFTVVAGLLWYLPFFVAVMFGQYIYTVRFEEAFLRSRFGQEFEDYCRSTRRWIPSLRAYSSRPADFSPYPLRRLLERERSFLLLQAAGGTAALLVLRLYVLPFLTSGPA